MNSSYRFLFLFLAIVLTVGCAPIEYSVVIVEASQAISEAKVAGAGCTQAQLDSLSPTTQNSAPDPGTELVSSEESAKTGNGLDGRPLCAAPYEYYSAVEYLTKAREEVGYSDYEAAIEYARQSRIFARKARDIAITQSRERGR